MNYVLTKTQQKPAIIFLFSLFFFKLDYIGLFTPNLRGFAKRAQITYFCERLSAKGRTRLFRFWPSKMKMGYRAIALIDNSWVATLLAHWRIGKLACSLLKASFRANDVRSLRRICRLMENLENVVFTLLYFLTNSSVILRSKPMKDA